MQYAQKFWLLTSLHVITGINPTNRFVLSTTGCVPTRITFFVLISESNTDRKRRRSSILVREDDRPFRYRWQGGLVWFDDHDATNQNDYCAIPLEAYVPQLKEEKYSLRAIEGGKVTLKKDVRPAQQVGIEDINHFYPAVGHQVFVLGYPDVIKSSGIFPILKGATIASEPLVGLSFGEWKSDKLFYVDALTKSGMSGAPVVCLPKPGDLFYTDDGVVVEAPSPQPFLVGIYAGRDGVIDQEYGLALGRVWKVSAFEDLLLKSSIKLLNSN
jgi:hypothetical protein